MTLDVVPQDLAGVIMPIAPAWDQAMVLATEWSRPETLAAVLVGAAAVFSGARLLLLAVGLLLAADLAVAFGHIDAAPGWLFPLCVLFALLGVVQGAVTVIAGEETFGDLLLAVLGLALTAGLFLIWKWPSSLLVRALRRGDSP